MAHRLSVPQVSREVPAEQVRQLTTDLLGEQLPLGRRSYRYADADIFNVVVAAAAQGRSLTSVCRQLADAPSANLVRHALTGRLLEQECEALEAQLNALLVARLPIELRRRPLRLAIDLTLLPFYGRVVLEPDQLRRGVANAVTTRFLLYVTAFV